MLDSVKTKLLKSVYFNVGESAAFGGVAGILKQVKKMQTNHSISPRDVQEFLELQTPYSLHRKHLKKFKRNVTFSPRVNYQWSTDLMDMTNIKKNNDDYSYILVVIDSLSRYLYTEKLRSKTAEAVTVAFKNIFKRTPELPQVINSDKGKEFTNKLLQALFKKHSIHYFTSYGEHKASQAERVIKTLKELFYRYFDHTLQRKWHDKLQDFTNTYNTNFNRAINMTPEEALALPNRIMLSEKLFKIAINRKKCQADMKKGDYVRVNLGLGAFSKSYEANWSRALYKITKGPYYTRGGTLPLYQIKEPWGDEVIEGGFYPQELLRVDEDTYVKNYSFPIHKVVKKGPKTSLVRWLGYEKRHDSRVPNSDIKNIALF